jgi:hypothetical protein
MNRLKLHKDYLGFRLYMIGEDGFERDRFGRYFVHVLVSEIGSQDLYRIPIPKSYAWTSQEAEKLSWEHGMLLIEQGRIPHSPSPIVPPELPHFSRRRRRGVGNKQIKPRESA